MVSIICLVRLILVLNVSYEETNKFFADLHDNCGLEELIIEYGFREPEQTKRVYDFMDVLPSLVPDVKSITLSKTWSSQSEIEQQIDENGNIIQGDNEQQYKPQQLFEWKKFKQLTKLRFSCDRATPSEYFVNSLNGLSDLTNLSLSLGQPWEEGVNLDNFHLDITNVLQLSTLQVLHLGLHGYQSLESSKNLYLQLPELQNLEMIRITPVYKNEITILGDAFTKMSRLSWIHVDYRDSNSQFNEFMKIISKDGSMLRSSLNYLQLSVHNQNDTTEITWPEKWLLMLSNLRELNFDISETMVDRLSLIKIVKEFQKFKTLERVNFRINYCNFIPQMTAVDKKKINTFLNCGFRGSKDSEKKYQINIYELLPH